MRAWSAWVGNDTWDMLLGRARHLSATRSARSAGNVTHGPESAREKPPVANYRGLEVRSQTSVTAMRNRWPLLRRRNSSPSV